ncbi:MAG: thioredoxin domain-containing protein [Candidatus Omnitrophica bacterium CG11_big_fil_rev_8_21_14_0_20_63_9]|nr:MAG: thioredoxin domain-containing protein [Candidatus Omnitrophica bacterium CG11_big_fil_rev_8_21_14_0_20_63_9]
MALQTNRLAREKSPYLLQHAHNPVDWYPWGEEAFAKARQEQKPIFLSIGYSTCHWCHVMERESFEKPETAELLNRWFVSIKVDREEHPDVDHVYMQAVTALTGRGGWPLSVFLTPELKPFFGGTYFPPERRWQMASFREVLTAVAQAWEQKRQEVTASAEQLTTLLSQPPAETAATAPITEELLHMGFRQAEAMFDPVHGGFGDAPKFPRAHELAFLLRYWVRTRQAQALQMVTTTLDSMAQGGLYDHVGGGFHRYATDAQWLVPHFEKMLYDQALLARVYVEAFQVTGRADYAQVVRGTCEYVLRDLQAPEGAFYSAEDADSEGEEGKFYVWTPSEITAVLGPEEAALFHQVYGVTEQGNFEHRTSILHLQQPPDASVERRLASARRKLFDVRERRVRPHRDDKVLTGWNGLMIAALARAGAALEEPRYVAAAERAAEFVLGALVRERGLLRRYRDGDARYLGTLEDYAFLLDGLLALYEADFNPRWLAEAKRLAGEMDARFRDPQESGWFLRDREEPALIVRPKEIYDGATPSGNSVATLILLRLGRLLGDDSLEASARKALEGFSQALARAPYGSPWLLCAVDMALGPAREIIIAGDLAQAATRAMVRALHQRFLPRDVSAVHEVGREGAALEALIPFVKQQQPLGGKATAYVCERFACQAPVSKPEALAKLLEGGG